MLSPGTRGIVLLLYLALDDSDHRPLIIDQPEENLDPIIVTLNTNLVINTDADQIIVAEAGQHPSGVFRRSATWRAVSKTQEFVRRSAKRLRAAKPLFVSANDDYAFASIDDVGRHGSDGPTHVTLTLSVGRSIRNCDYAQVGITKLYWGRMLINFSWI